MLFKLDVLYLKEDYALKYALSKLEDSKKQTMKAFHSLSNDAGKLSFHSDHHDTSLPETSAEMSLNINKINSSKATF